MIVEFIGSTGAGKTTVAAALRAELCCRVRVASSFEVVAGGWLAGLEHPTARNLAQEALAGLSFARALPAHAPFIRFVTSRIWRQTRTGVQALRYLRSLERTVGVHETVRRRALAGVVLVDEGTFLAAHNLFVFGPTSPHRDELARFADVVPLPDVLVYVRAPVATIVERSLARSDSPREMRSCNRAQVATYARRAAAVYDALVAAPRIRDRVITVDNLDASEIGQQAAARRVAECVLETNGGTVKARAIGRAL